MKTKKNKRCLDGKYLCDVKDGKITSMYRYDNVLMSTFTVQATGGDGTTGTTFVWDGKKLTAKKRKK